MSPPQGPAAACPALARALPGTLDGRAHRRTTPTSRRTAAWGNPPVVLRCGVTRPAGLQPTSQVVEVDGVEWFLAGPGPAYVFTTVGRGVYLQVQVPGSVPQSQATAPLVDLAAAVKKTVPLRQ